MTEKKKTNTRTDKQDISKLMNVFDDDSSIENIEKQIEETQTQLINNEFQKIKKITDDGDTDTAYDLLKALKDKFSDNDTLREKQGEIKQDIDIKKVDIQLQEAKSLYDEGKYADAVRLVKGITTATDEQYIIRIDYNEVFQSKLTDVQLQEAKSLYDEGKYADAIKLLKKVETITNEQEELYNQYKELFQSKKEEANKQKTEQEIDRLITEIDATNIIDGYLQAMAEKIKTIIDLVGSVSDEKTTGKYKYFPSVEIIETFRKAFLEKNQKDWEKSKKLLRLLSTRIILNPVMQNILLIGNIHDTHIGNIISCKPCKEKLKKVLGIKTRLIGKTEIQNINQLIDDGEKENARKKILIEKLIYMGRHPGGLEDEIVKSIENIKKNNNDINYQNSNGNTTLILAARHGNKDIVKLLLKHPDININRRDSDGYTAQGWAIKKGYNAIANLIKKHSKSK